MICALQAIVSCHAAELPIVQLDIRHSTDVRSAPGAQVDPLSLGITEGIPFVLFGFRNVLVRAHRMSHVPRCAWPHRASPPSISLAGLSYTRSAQQASRQVTRLGFS